MYAVYAVWPKVGCHCLRLADEFQPAATVVVVAAATCCCCAIFVVKCKWKSAGQNKLQHQQQQAATISEAGTTCIARGGKDIDSVSISKE